MKIAVRGIWFGAVLLVGVLQLAGCPSAVPTLEYIAGGRGEEALLRSTPEVTVLTPVSDLSISGGTQVELNWRAFARTRTSTLAIIVDVDRDPNNANEILAEQNLSITVNTALLDTTELTTGTYYVGVLILEVGDVVAFDYAPGRVIVDQRPQLYFYDTEDSRALARVYSARDNIVSDRTDQINLTIDVSWNLYDPDSTDVVDVYLDPDDTPSGNEVFLFHSDSQSGDAFRFDLPTMAFEAGTYRILAVVSDGRSTFNIYSPGSIRLRSRLAGALDLRDLDTGRIEGAVFEGVNPRDNAGSFVTSIGDIDRDGFADFVILAQFAKPRYLVNSARGGIGEAYLIYGRSKRFTGAVNLNSTGTLFRGEIYMGVPEVADPIRPSRGISSFALLSDWDSDGVREMAFGVPFTDSASVDGFGFAVGGVRIAPLDPPGYFRTGAVVIAAGLSLRPDLGYPGRNVLNLAEFGTLAHIPFSIPACPEGFYGPKAPASSTGGATSFHQHLVDQPFLSDVPNAGSVRLGCRFSSAEFGDQFGETVSAWDFDALIMSAPNRDPRVSVERVSTALASYPGAGVISVYYNDVKDGFYPWTNGNAPQANTDTGYLGSEASSGDRRLPHGGPYHYLIDDLQWTPGYSLDLEDGAPCGFTSDARLGFPTRTVRLWSNRSGARLSNAKGVGDLNSDGFADLLIGSPEAGDGNGACYVVFGRLRDLIVGGELQIEELSLAMDASDPDLRRVFEGIQILGSTGERLGQSLDDAGDFNNDGFGDIIIGSPLVNNRRGGACVFYGSRDVINLTQTEIPYAEIPSRGLGVIFVGEEDDDLAGARVSAAGDVDADGNDDILIAAPNRSVRTDLNQDGYPEIDRTECGVVYLIYGAPDMALRRTPGGEQGVLELKYVGTDALPGAVFIGRQSGDHLGAGLGLQGDRSVGIARAGDVDGDGFIDLILGSVDASPRDRVASGGVYLVYGRGD